MAAKSQAPQNDLPSKVGGVKPAGDSVPEAESSNQPPAFVEVKEVTEVVRALGLTLGSLQRGISRVVTPYFALTVVFVLTLFKTDLPPIANLGTLYYGGYTDSQGQYVGGFQVEGFRSITLALMALLLFYMFIRFGFLYYQGIKLIVRLQSYIGASLEPQGKYDAARILRQVCKENYLVQAFVVLRSNSTSIGLEGGTTWVNMSKLLSLVLIGIFVYFLGLSQFAMMVYLASLSGLIGFIVAAVFVAYYVMFGLGIFIEKDGGRASSPYPVPFVVAFALLVTGNLYCIFAGYTAGLHLDYIKVTQAKIDGSLLLFIHSYLFRF